MPDDDNLSRMFYPHSVNARHDYGVSGIRWHRIANVNGTIEIKSLVSRVPKNFQFAMAWRRAALSGNTSLIATFSSCFFFLLISLSHQNLRSLLLLP